MLGIMLAGLTCALTRTTHPRGLPLFLGTLGLLVMIEAFVQWFRATRAWKRRGPRHGPGSPSLAAVRGDALAGGST